MMQKYEKLAIPAKPRKENIFHNAKPSLGAIEIFQYLCGNNT